MSYLNTVPLVWGLLHSTERERFEMFFRLPSECADLVAAGGADLGILPVFELLHQELDTVPGVGIACRGAVRSILLVSRCAAARIETLAADSSSRTSVALARIILEKRYGAKPLVVPHAPDLPAMLARADAALIIGDPALRIDPDRLEFQTYDLGAEWFEMTGLPMVFAVWAGRRGVITQPVARAFQDSCRYGLERLEEIVASEAPARGFSPELVREYLSRHIVHQLGRPEVEGMELFLRYARELSAPAAATPHARSV